MAYCFNSEVRVINFIYKVENSEGGEGDKNKDDRWEDGSNDFNFLRIKDIFVSEFCRDYCYDDIKH